MEKFQFHKGTIRTNGSIDIETKCIVFQFHKGTIRTPKALKYAAFIANFNSIKVQLERGSGYRSEDG